MASETRSLRVQIAVLGTFFAVRATLQLWTLAFGPLPGLNEGLPLAPNVIAYGIAASWVAYLVWRRKPRARMAAYVFLTFDIVRALRHDHWLLIAADLAVLAYLQTPAMRNIYPSMWSRGRRILARAAGR